MAKQVNKIPHGIKRIDIEQKVGRGRPKTLDRDTVLNLAMTSFWHKGPEVSLNSICELAGVAKPSLYREFGNEDGLASAALDRYHNLVFPQLESLFLGSLTFAKKLETLSLFICEDETNQFGCLFVKMRAARAQLGAKTQSKVEEVDLATLKLYRNFLKQSRESGQWTSHLSDRSAANYLSSQIEMALSQRARGVKSSEVRAVLEIGLSVLQA